MTTPTPAGGSSRRKMTIPALALVCVAAVLVVAVVFHERWQSAEAERDHLGAEWKQTLAALDALRDEKTTLEASLNELGNKHQKAENAGASSREMSEQLNLSLDRVKADLARAVAARDRLALDRDKIIATEYGRTILLAHTRFQEGDILGARSLLDTTRKELRGWEWQYLNQLLTPRLPVVAFGVEHQKNLVLIREPVTGKELGVIKGDNLDVGHIEFSPDRKRIVTIPGDRIPIDIRDKAARVWDARSGSQLAVLTGHTEVISTVLWTPDGTRIVTGSYDRTVRVWDSNTGKELLSLFKGHLEGVSSASFNAAGSRIVTASADNTARVWDAITGKQLLILSGPTNAVPGRDRKKAVTRAVFNPKGSRIATVAFAETTNGFMERTVTIWDTTTGKQLCTFKVPGWGGVSSPAWSNDGKRIVVGSDRSAIVWDAETGKEIVTLKAQEKQPDLWDVLTVAFSPDDTQIITGCQLGLQEWDAKTGELLRTRERDIRDVRAVSFRPKGMRLALAAGFNEAEVKDTESGTLVTLKGHTDGVTVASFSPDGQFVATGSRDQTARVWDAATGKALLTLKGHVGVVTSVSYSADGLRIITGSEDTSTRIWDAKTGEPRFILPGHTGSVDAKSISPEGSRIMTGGRVWDMNTGEQLTLIGERAGHSEWSPDGKRILGVEGNAVRVWDTATGKELFALKGSPAWTRWGPHRSDSSYSPDGTRILTTGNEDGSPVARVWDAATGKELALLKTASVRWGPRGRVLMGTNPDGTIGIWDAETGASVVAVLRHPLPLRSPVWSPDGSRILTATRDELVQVWDATTGRRLATFTGAEVLHNQDNKPVIPGVWSPDGNSVRTKTGIWDINPGPRRFDLRGHATPIRSAEWSPDGRRVVTTSGEWATVGGDYTARIWDARTGEPLLVLRGHKSSVRSAAWSRDGKLLVTASQDGTVRIWDAATGSERLVIKVQTENTHAVSTASFSPDGSRVLIIGSDIRVLDAATGEKVAVLEYPRDYKSASWSADGQRIVTAGRSWDSSSGNGVWDAATGKPITKGLADIPAVRPEEIYHLAARYGENTLTVWNPELRKEVAVLKGHTGEIKFAAWSPSGKQLVTTSNDKTARVWNATTGKELAVLKGHSDTVWKAFWSPDGTQIVTASGDNSTRVWDARSGKQTGVLKHPHSLNVGGDNPDSLVWSPDGRRILIRTTSDPDEYGARDAKIVQIWDVETGNEVAHFWGHNWAGYYTPVIKGITWTADGTRFTTEGGDRTVREWDARTGEQSGFVRRLSKRTDGSTAVGGQWQGEASGNQWGKSPDGSRTITFLTCGSLEMFNARTGDLMITFTHQFSTEKPPRLLWSPGGKRVLIGRELVDVETGTPLATLPWQAGEVAVWTADGSRLATAGDDGTVRVWDGKTGAELLLLSGEQREPDDPRRAPAPRPHVTSVTWSLDGKRLLVVYVTGVAWVWDSQPREWPLRLFPEAPAPRVVNR